MSTQTVSPLLSGNYTILCEAALVSLLYLIGFFSAYSKDNGEKKQCALLFFQKDITSYDQIYSISISIKKLYYNDDTVDLIFRFRGTKNDSPLILFRDLGGKILRQGSDLNLGLALPQSIGELLEVDFACDSEFAEEAEPTLIISNLIVRKLRVEFTPTVEFLSTFNQPFLSTFTFSADISPYCYAGKFLTFLMNSAYKGGYARKNGSVLDTWIGLETLEKSAGSGIAGVNSLFTGRPDQVLRSRDVSLTLCLTKENERLKQRMKAGFCSLHYIISLSPTWHELWSDFSSLDNALVMCLDQLATFVVVCTCYAFALEDYLGGGFMLDIVSPFLPGQPSDFKAVEQFDLYDFFPPNGQAFRDQSKNLILICWISFVSCLCVIPISLIWYRLFRLIGGREFNASLCDALQEASLGAPGPSCGPIHPQGSATLFCSKADSNSLLLRTLECKSTHTASCVTSTRRLRMEPMISNCEADTITARSVAYVRTKMTRLRNEDILSGSRGLKEPEMLHESQSQSTDAPCMPLPNNTTDSKMGLQRMARFCERLVQQDSTHINDNSIITECFEVMRNSDERTGGLLERQPAVCCPKKCCQRSQPCQRESLSNATFFTEEDAISVKEMMSDFSMLDNTDIKKENDVMRSEPQRGTKQTMGAIRILANMFDGVPAPSGDVHKNLPDTKSSQGIRKTAHLTSTSTASGPTEDQNTHIQIGRAVGERRISEVGKVMTKLANHIRQPSNGNTVNGRSSVFDLNSTPLPSAFSPNRPYMQRHPIYDSVPLTNTPSYHSRNPAFGRRSFQLPFKGTKFKLFAFLVLALIQLSEIAFVSFFQLDANKFFSSGSPKSVEGGGGRMHAASLSCVLAAFMYFIFTLQLVALFSMIIERSMLAIKSNREINYYGTTYYSP